jgi:hypothetical protein
MRHDTRKTPQITTGIRPYARKMAFFTTGISHDTRKMATITTGKTVYIGSRENDYPVVSLYYFHNCAK